MSESNAIVQGDHQSRAALFVEVAELLQGTGQDLANAIANERNGCFEFCDGWPGVGPDTTLIIDTVNFDEFGTADDESARAALCGRASKIAAVTGRLNAFARGHCPSAYSLFQDDGELYDDNNEPVRRACPIAKSLVAEMTAVVAEIYPDGV